MSLHAIATKVGVSVATLSRIETNKQGIDLPFFLELAHAIGIEPAELIGENGNAGSSDALARRLAAFPPDERAQIMAAAARDAAPNGTRSDLHRHLDALVTTLDVLRNELLEIRIAVRRKGD